MGGFFCLFVFLFFVFFFFEHKPLIVHTWPGKRIFSAQIYIYIYIYIHTHTHTHTLKLNVNINFIKLSFFNFGKKERNFKHCCRPLKSLLSIKLFFNS